MGNLTGIVDHAFFGLLDSLFHSNQLPVKKLYPEDVMRPIRTNRRGCFKNKRPSFCVREKYFDVLWTFSETA